MGEVITAPPTLFISYSHDSQEHQDWVLQLGTRLVANGINVILDQWDATLGSNLQAFMESGATESARVLAICSETYVNKADAHQGGVGYEKTILTADLLSDLSSNRVIPLIRNNESSNAMPRFLSGRMYIDFRDDSKYEEKYAKLLYELYGRSMIPRPPLGKNPFLDQPVDIAPKLSEQSARYVSPGLSGKVTFDYTNNSGKYVIGSGELTFELKWSGAGQGSIHAYRDQPSIRTIALAENMKEIASIRDGRLYDASSRSKTAREGDVIVWQNSTGYFAVTLIESVTTRDSPNGKHELIFTYRIQPDRSARFSTLRSKE